MKEPKNCLIVDDDPDDQEIFMMCLDTINNSIHCSTANDGVEAISMLKSDSKYIPDYIFIDVNMPKMHGIDCLRIMKGMERLKDSRFFMYSTTSDAPTLAKSRELGAEDFIIKPPSISVLKERLTKIFAAA